MRAVLIAAVAAALGGCSTVGSPQVQEQQIWLRSDGQSGRDNPELAQRFEADRAACTDPSGGINRTCMARFGYVLVPESQAAARAAELRAAAAASAQQ